jgi:hypothetical protein
MKTGVRSPLVQSAVQLIIENARQIRDAKLRAATLDAVSNPRTCVAHRAGVTDEVKITIQAKLVEQGLLEAGSAKAGVFPPLKNDGGACPQLPLTLAGAPGSGFDGHHSYPGGLAVHEAFNLQSAKNFATLYRSQYGIDFVIDQDFVIGAPAWHDWAKTMVFQWNADGSEFEELSFGGLGRNDNNGATGDSRTGAHHILGLAEAMARGMPPGFVITQASAHAAPSLGNEYKVVNWLRAAAIVARVDAVAAGYLVADRNGHLRLPPLDHLGDGIDLNDNGQTNLLLEYQIHNLSDADFVESIPAVSIAQILLKKIASQFGYDPADRSSYNNKFRNVVLANVGPERLTFLYSSYGLAAATKEVGKLKTKKLI